MSNPTTFDRAEDGAPYSAGVGAMTAREAGVWQAAYDREEQGGGSILTAVHAGDLAVEAARLEDEA